MAFYILDAGIKLYIDSDLRSVSPDHKTHSRKNTVRSYRAIVERFIREFADGPIDKVTPEQILTFLNRLTAGNKPYTKRVRYSHLSAFFNFFRYNLDSDLNNLCDSPMIRKLYREKGAEAIFYIHIKYCESQDYDLPDIKVQMREEGITFLELETEYQTTHLSQMKTRLQAFYESVIRKGLS